MTQEESIKLQAFLTYCYFQLVLGFLVIVIIYFHPESEIYLIPSIIVNLFIPAILIYVSHIRLDVAALSMLAINFVSTTSYAITAEIVDQNGMSTMFFLTYLIQAAMVGIVFNMKYGYAYLGIGFIIILLKQLGIFKPLEFEFVYNYKPIEFMVFLTLFMLTIFRYIHLARQQVLDTKKPL